MTQNGHKPSPEARHNRRKLDIGARLEKQTSISILVSEGSAAICHLFSKRIRARFATRNFVGCAEVLKACSPTFIKYGTKTGLEVEAIDVCIDFADQFGSPHTEHVNLSARWDRASQ